MKKSILKISDIVIDEKLYPRVKISDKTIKSYVSDMNRGDVFPPLYVGFFKGKSYLIDGMHRLEAYRVLGEQYIQCEVKTNFTNFDEMFLAAFRANQKHGVRFNLKDKLKVALILKNMKYDIGDINKLTGISTKKIEKIFSGKVSHVLIKDKIKSGELPSIIKDKVPNNVELKLVDDKEIKKLEEGNKEEWQLYELKQINDYFKTTEFVIDNREISNLIGNIKKSLKRKFPKL